MISFIMRVFSTTAYRNWKTKTQCMQHAGATASDQGSSTILDLSLLLLTNLYTYTPFRRWSPAGGRQFIFTTLLWK